MATPRMDWEQVRLNGGPPCFALLGETMPDGTPRYCGRAERWSGHPADHAFVATPHCTEHEQRIVVLIEALTEAGRMVHTYICPADGHSAGCIEITDALAAERSTRRRGSEVHER